MTETAPKKRGRPSTGSALSSTERSRKLREQVDEVLHVAFHLDRPLGRFADSVLLLAFQHAYRQRWDSYVREIGAELMRRVGIEATFKDVDATTIAEGRSAEPEPISVESTDIPQSREPEPPVADGADSLPEGLSDRDRRILELHQAGVSNREIGRRLDISESTIRYRLSRMAQR